jgi:hypothetical protein
MNLLPVNTDLGLLEDLFSQGTKPFLASFSFRRKEL